MEVGGVGVGIPVGAGREPLHHQHHHHRRQIQEDEDRQMLPCRFYSSGFCQKGNRCRFYHPSPNGIGLASLPMAPPLPSNFGFGAAESSRRLIHQQQQQQHEQQFQGGGRDAHRGRHGPRSHPHQHGFNPMGTGGRQARSLFSMLRSGGPGLRPHHRNSNHNGYQEPNYISEADDYGYFIPSHELANPESGDEDFIESQLNFLNGAAGHGNSRNNNNGYAHPPSFPEEFYENMSPPEVEHQTVFGHIDWSEFLIPGCLPPPPTHVPEQHQEESKPRGPMAKALSCAQSAGNSDGTSSHTEDSTDETGSTGSPKGRNEDMPPEGSSLQGQGSMEERGSSSGQGRMTAKEELQMKVKKIAQELAEEPPYEKAPSMDMFLNFDFSSLKKRPSTNNPLRKLLCEQLKVVDGPQMSKVEEEHEQENEIGSCPQGLKVTGSEEEGAEMEDHEVDDGLQRDENNNIIMSGEENEGKKIGMIHEEVQKYYSDLDESL